MRFAPAIALFTMLLAAVAPAQTLDKELVASIAAPALDLWIARADGAHAERILHGPVTLPAWSEDGRLIAVTERKDDGARWDISIVRVPERFRQ
jgi:Tol biopolymer transport system component